MTLHIIIIIFTGAKLLPVARGQRTAAAAAATEASH